MTELAAYIVHIFEDVERSQRTRCGLPSSGPEFCVPVERAGDDAWRVEGLSICVECARHRR